MDFAQLAAMQPKRWAAKDCVLLLWVTDPMLRKALELIETWGFVYKTVGFYWAKTNKRADLNALSQDDFFTGLGYWSRANVEQCLLATRGSPPRMAKDVKRLVISQRTQPEAGRDLRPDRTSCSRALSRIVCASVPPRMGSVGRSGKIVRRRACANAQPALQHGFRTEEVSRTLSRTSVIAAFGYWSRRLLAVAAGADRPPHEWVD
jgi:hypothetical protein